MESRLGPVQTRGLAPPGTLSIAGLLDAAQEGHIAIGGSWKGH